MTKTTLYKLDSTGKIREWNIEVSSNAEIITSSGAQGMKFIEVKTLITSGKNIGRANETTPYTQAVLDAQTEINTKLKKGYVTDVTLVKVNGSTATIKAPMKGQKYHPTGAQNNSFTLDKLKLRGVTVGIQKKLEGFRYRILVNKTDIIFYSSGGDVVPAFPHVEAQIRKAFDKNIAYWESKYGITEHYLDGEMYNHQVVQTMGFEAIQTACGTRKNISPETFALRSRLEFHLFDVCLDAPYITRNKVLDYYADNISVIKVETEYVKADEDIIEDLFNQYLTAGYEGLMIRTLNQPYEYKKGKQLLKYKPVMDEEFQIVGFDKSITGDTLGALVCKMDDGRTFNADLKDYLGTDKMKQSIWDNQKDWLGKFVTVSFLNYTKAGFPRHPKAFKERKGKSID